MHDQSTTNLRVLSQADPLHNNAANKRGSTIMLVIDGCTVTLTSSAKGSQEAIQAAKEILLSAYRFKAARS